MQLIPSTNKFLKPTYDVTVNKKGVLTNIYFLSKEFAMYLQHHIKHSIKYTIISIGKITKEDNINEVYYFIQADDHHNYKSTFQYKNEKDAIYDAKKFKLLQSFLYNTK